MRAGEFRALREGAGWSAWDAAIELSISPDDVERYERGERDIPRRIAKQLATFVRWEASAKEHARLMADCTLPECDEFASMLRARKALPATADAASLVASLRPLQRHFDSCPVCRARDDYARRHMRQR